MRDRKTIDRVNFENIGENTVIHGANEGDN